MSTQFDLSIRATDELELPVRLEANQVARAIQARAWRRRKGIWDESLCGERRVIQVASGQAIATDEEFAAGPDRDRLQLSVKRIRLRIRNRTPY
jgi:hypothetical protein